MTLRASVRSPVLGARRGDAGAGRDRERLSRAVELECSTAKLFRDVFHGTKTWPEHPSSLV